MADKKSTNHTTAKPQNKDAKSHTGEGGELHQSSDTNILTTNQGTPISDDQNSLKIGARGPTLLEDFVLREKITHFDHERIPERVVHARGSGAHGYFETYSSFSKYTKADFLQRKGQRTEVFVRFSTVAGGAGSVDLPRDVRGFSTKFYTNEGNFDLVGNNIPVFFIQDAMKFPDLVHSVKMEPDRGFPQAAAAHDTFWDFVSLMPESTNMLMWAMSDRAIPRSYRMMEGFGVHTFRLVDSKGESTFVKFHWRPKLGIQSVVWDEAVKINGADNDFHRRDLWMAIESGDFPEYELSFQLFTEEQANSLPFDVLDATKVIPEELVPLTPVGRMVLDRNPDNFFQETEQAAFCPANIVPGIDFTNDPLLQGRIFSYLDTQLIRLGGPNFHQIPVNAPKCPMHNFQRDGFMRMQNPKGRVNYEPNSLAADSPGENKSLGFQSFPRSEGGGALRVRPESFADHYSQARMFWLSQTPTEQNHIVAAFVFELSMVETLAIRERMVGNLIHVDQSLAQRVATGLGLAKLPPASETKVMPKPMNPSSALGIISKNQETFKGRVVGCLVTDGTDPGIIDELQRALAAEGTKLKIIAPKIGGVTLQGGRHLAANFALSGGPSVIFDAVVLAPSAAGVKDLAREAAAIDFLRDAFGHLKVIGFVEAAALLFQEAKIDLKQKDQGLVDLGGNGAVMLFIGAAKKKKIWDREPKVRTSY